MKCAECNQTIKSDMVICFLDGSKCWHPRCTPKKKFDSKKLKKLAAKLAEEEEL